MPCMESQNAKGFVKKTFFEPGHGTMVLIASVVHVY